MFLALGVLVRFPAVPSASLHRLGFVMTPLVRQLGYASASFSFYGVSLPRVTSQAWLRLHLGQVRWSVPGWTSRLCLRVSARPVTQGVLPGGPHCVLTIRLTLALSRVLHGPLLGLSVASPTLASGLGWSFVPYPLFCRLGLVPRSVARLCALQQLVPSFQVYLSLLCAPLAVGLLPGSPTRLCPLSADCLLGLEPSPSCVASASDGRFSWHPGAAGALAVPSLRLRVSESSSLSAWSFPFRGL